MERDSMPLKFYLRERESEKKRFNKGGHSAVYLKIYGLSLKLNYCNNGFFIDAINAL